MANVIDSLVVTLGLDSAKFKKGAEDATKAQNSINETAKKGAKEQERISKKEAAEREKHFKASQEQSKKSAESIKKIRHQALATLAVFAGGMGMLEFAKNTIFTSAAIGRMSDNIGMSVRQIAGYEGAIKSVGGTSSDALGLLSGVAGSLGNLRAGKGMDAMMSTYSRYGGAAVGVNTTEAQYLSGIATLIHKIYKQNPLKARSVAESMGLSNAAFNLLKQGPKAVQGMVSTYGNASGMTMRLAKVSEHLQRQLALISLQLRKVGIEILTALMPSIEKVVKQFQIFGQWTSTHGKQITKWTQEFASALSEIAHYANVGANFLGGWKNVLIGLAAFKVASIAAGFLGLGGALASVGAGLASILAASGAIPILVAAGTGYFTGKYTLDPLINAAGGYLTGDKDWTLGNGLYSAIHGTYNPNSPGNGEAQLRAMRKAHHIQSQAQEQKALNSFRSHPSKFMIEARHTYKMMHGTIHRTNNASNISNSIGEIHIHTQATDANGIAQTIGPAINKHGFVHQANTGIR